MSVSVTVVVPGIGSARLGDRRADDRAVVHVLARHRNRGSGVDPGLVDVQQAIPVGVAARRGTADGHALVVRHHHVRQRNVARIGDDVREGHRAAHRHDRARRAVVVRAVGQLDDIHTRHRAEVVFRIGVVQRCPLTVPVPVAVPRFAYCPATATPVAVKSHTSSGSRSCSC